MEEEKITLDKQAFKALASDTRVSILKSLGRRRKMLTELSKQLGMSPSTVKEHMDSLSDAGLVVQIDDGHKWKYYELTRKGENVLNPHDSKIWIILSLSLLGMFIAAADMLSGISGKVWTTTKGVPTGANDMVRGIKGTSVMDEAAPMMAAETTEALAATAPQAAQVPYVHMAAIVLFGVVVALCIYHIIRKKY